jgi:hypothetical protein
MILAQFHGWSPPSLAKQGTATQKHIINDILRGRDPDDFKALVALGG